MSTFLLSLLALFASVIPINPEFTGCSSSDLNVWKRSLASKQPKLISVIAGRNTTIECDAFAEFTWGDGCEGVTVEWKMIFERPAPNDPGRTEEVVQTISTWTTENIGYLPDGANKTTNSSMEPFQECFSDTRYCGHKNQLTINYAQPDVDDRRLFQCKVSRIPRPPSAPSEKAFSVYKLQVEKCPNLGEKKKGKGYRGGPCHYGKCFLRKMPKITFKYNGSLRHALNLECVCLPGYKGEFCKDPTNPMSWMKNFAPYFWMLLTWMPAMVAAVALIIAVVIYGNGRTELIFKEGESLSPYVKVGGALPKSPAPSSKKGVSSKKG